MDTIRFTDGYPDCDIQAGATFQTDGLGGFGSNYTITWDGQLIEHVSFNQAANHAHCVREHHGDIFLIGKYYYELVVRFTHGRVEWVQRIEHPPGTDLNAPPETIMPSESLKAELDRRLQMMRSGAATLVPLEEMRECLRVERIRRISD